MKADLPFFWLGWAGIDWTQTQERQTPPALGSQLFFEKVGSNPEWTRDHRRGSQLRTSRSSSPSLSSHCCVLSGASPVLHDFSAGSSERDLCLPFPHSPQEIPEVSTFCIPCVHVLVGPIQAQPAQGGILVQKRWTEKSPGFMRVVAPLPG